jgi:hypothetical protein
MALLQVLEGASTADQTQVENDIEDAIAELLERGTIGFTSADIPSASLSALSRYVASFSALKFFDLSTAQTYVADREAARRDLIKINGTPDADDATVYAAFF